MVIVGRMMTTSAMAVMMTMATAMCVSSPPRLLPRDLFLTVLLLLRVLPRPALPSCEPHSVPYGRPSSSCP
eukprot:9391942-Pyramimonas_sp.AAC.1